MSKTTRAELAQTWGSQLAWYLENRREIPLARPGYGAPPQIRPTGSCRLMTFALKLQHSADHKKLVGLEEEVALELGARLCTIRRHYGEVLVVLPLPQHLWTFIDSTRLPRKEGTWVCLGYGADMQPVYVDVAGNSISPMLVAGRTSSGKTELLKLVITQLAQQNTPETLQFILQDPKFKFEAVQYLPHLTMPILRTHAESAIGVAWALREMKARMEGAPRGKRIIVIFDELIDVIGADPNSEIALGVGELARLGREMNINLIFASQRPDRKFMDKLSAANIGLRAVGKVTDGPEAVVACGMGGTPARNLEGKGDMILILNGEVVNRFQCAMVPERKFAALPRTEELPAMPQHVKGLLEEMGMRMQGQMTTIQVPPFSVDELAVGLTGKGIIALKRELSMGQPKATRLRNEWAKPLLDKLRELGYTLTKGDVESVPVEEESHELESEQTEIEFPASTIYD